MPSDLERSLHSEIKTPAERNIRRMLELVLETPDDFFAHSNRCQLFLPTPRLQDQDLGQESHKIN
jgi:hypothetical protein